MILTLERSHVGEGEGGAGEGLEVGELEEVDGRDGDAVGELSITGNLHKRRGEGGEGTSFRTPTIADCDGSYLIL